MTFTLAQILKRSALAGFVVGIVAALYLVLITEPVIDQAIALEEAMAAAEEAGVELAPAEAATVVEGSEEEPLFTRPEQVVGGAAAALVYTLILALVFGIVFAKVRHRIPGRVDFTRSLWLSSVAFGTVALMPALKYPATPPAVGDPDTVGERTALFLVLVALSLLIAWGLMRLSGVLRASLDDRSRVVVMALATVGAYGLLMGLLPGTPDAIDPAVPADLVWRFRLRALGGLALMWGGIGLTLGWLLDRDADSAGARSLGTPVGVA